MAAYLSGQRGMTFISFLLMVGLIGFFTTLILKIGPVYLEHFKVKSALSALTADRDLASRSREEILKSLGKRWDIDMVDSVSMDDVSITRDINRVSVRVAYDVVKPLFGNVDVVVHFDDTIEAGAH
jgi:hypothetical protein